MKLEVEEGKPTLLRFWKTGTKYGSDLYWVSQVGQFALQVRMNQTGDSIWSISRMEYGFSPSDEISPKDFEDRTGLSKKDLTKLGVGDLEDPTHFRQGPYRFIIDHKAGVMERFSLDGKGVLVGYMKMRLNTTPIPAGLVAYPRGTTFRFVE